MIGLSMDNNKERVGNLVHSVDGLNTCTNQPINIIFEKGQIAQDLLQIISFRNKFVDDGTPRNITNNFYFAEGSVGKLLIRYHTSSNEAFLTNSTTNIRLEEDAVADMLIVQNEHTNSFHHTDFNIEIAANAHLKLIFISLHGGKIENNVTVNLNGERANVDISSLSLFDGNQIISNKLLVVHNKPNCTSHQLFKGILDDNAQSHFNGMINVVKDAQQTEAYQENHNLVLSDTVKVTTEPQLEIYADDVRCSHGATVGRLPDDEVFYMRSRGISEKGAKLLQLLAFAFTVLEKIDNTQLRDRMFILVEKRLNGVFSECNICDDSYC